MLAQRIYVHARRFPEKTAVVFNNRRISYRLFASLIGGAQRHLAQQGLPRQGIVVLPHAEILGSWILGLALRNLGLTTLAVRSLNELAGLGLGDIACVAAWRDETWPGIQDLCAASGWRPVGLRPEHHAQVTGEIPEIPQTESSPGGHILLTSGTTGTSKKFLRDPAAALAVLRDRQTSFGLNRDSVYNVLNAAGWTGGGYKYPASVWDVGGTVVIYQLPDLWESFRYPGITHAHAAASVLSYILEAPPDALRRNDSMRLFVGGGPLSREIWVLAGRRLTSRISTRISATEASTYAITPVVSPEDLRWHRILPSREVQVVDDEDRVLPVGHAGQVRVRMLTEGGFYLSDEAASRQFFRNGYFYPGDLGVFRLDGRLALLGRVTDVISILGSKMATGPIEAAFEDALGVSAVAIFSTRNDDGEEVIQIAIEAAQLTHRSRLRALLDTHLAGAAGVQVHLRASLPRNAMGKIQRDVLKRQIHGFARLAM